MASDNDIDRGKIGSWCEETMSLNKEQTHHTGTSLIALRDQDARKRRRRELYAEEGKELRNKRRREQRLNKTMNQIMNKEDRKFSRRNLLIAEGMINDGYYKNKECADHANYIGNHSLPRSSSAPGRGTNHANHIGNHSLPCSSSAPGRDGAFDLNMCEHSNNSGHDDEAVMQKKKKGAQVSCREYYCYKLQGKYWSPRKKGFVVGRIVAANPTEGERYYLRLLLNHVRGATSFENLKVVNNISASSFREAALLHGLLDGDTNCELCLEEACGYQMPNSLRRLFATILALCSPNDPKKLWIQFREFMLEDYVRNNLSVHEAELKALHYINSLLEPQGKSVNDYGLVGYDVDLREDERLARIIEDELGILVSETDLSCTDKLNKEQKIAYDMILDKVFSELGGVFFVDGPGGTGKTFLYRALLATVRSKNLIALATASSGVAAGLLPGGRTAHSRFKIPLEINTDMNCSISKQSALADLFRNTKLIIWDEAPMVNCHVVEALDKMLRDVNDCSLPFGGKVVVLGGDFRQVLPVVQRGNKEDIIGASLVNSYLWPSISKLKLVENMRANLDPSFSKYLLEIGNGTEKQHSCNMIKLMHDITLNFEQDLVSLQKLIDIVFPYLDTYVENIEYMINRVILTPKNDCVDQINNILIEHFSGDAFKHYSFNETLDKTEQSMQEDFLNTLTLNGIPPQELILKLNCPVILLRNINPSEGLCNGTRLI